MEETQKPIATLDIFWVNQLLKEIKYIPFRTCLFYVCFQRANIREPEKLGLHEECCLLSTNKLFLNRV